MEIEQTTAEEQVRATVLTIKWLVLKNGNILLRVGDECPGHLLLVADNYYVMSYNARLRGPFCLEDAKEILSRAIIKDCQEQISYYRAIEIVVNGDLSTWAFLKAKDPAVVAAVSQASAEESVDQPEPLWDDLKDTR